MSQGGLALSASFASLRSGRHCEMQVLAPILKSPDERKEILARSVAAEIGHGARVESQTEYQAVLVPERHTDHVLHLILTLVTRSVWAPVWLILAWLHGEKRTVARVDEYGRYQTSGNWLPSISREDRLARA